MNRMTKSLHRALLPTLLLILGCQPSTTSPPEAAPSAPPGSPAAAPADDAAPVDGQSDGQTTEEVTVQIKSWEDVQQLVAERSGDVVVVDVWSTWCAPCMREFPNLVKLQQTYPEGVACISVAANYAGLKDEPPESFRDEVLDFVGKQNAMFPNVISSTPDEVLYETIGAASVPIVLVYGPDGKLAKTFTNDDQQYGEEGFTYEDDIIPLVEQLLEQ